MKQFSFIMNKLGNYIASLREEKGWSQRELARRADVSFAQIQRIESGETESPGVQILVNISQTLNVPVINLINVFMGKPPETLPRKDDQQLKSVVLDLARQIPKEVLVEALRLHKEEREG